MITRRFVSFCVLAAMAVCAYADVAKASERCCVPSPVDRLGEAPLPIWPETTMQRPAVPGSPHRLPDGTVVVVARTEDGSYGLIPVTIHDGAPIRNDRGERGPGRQRLIDGDDFPALARTGLHDPAELEATTTITGLSVTEIEAAARPGGSSASGFIAADETLLGVLAEDNRRVGSLGLTHPELAAPLFHVWNTILAQRGKAPTVESIEYGGRRIRIQAFQTRGSQDSIFADEIMGTHDMRIEGSLSADEEAFLRERYGRLGAERYEELVRKLTTIKTGEMVAFYVKRYGFYEGHTGYRVDPITIAFLFGLAPLETIEARFAGALDVALTEHFGS